MSFIHYKFRSAKEVNTITFEGLGLPLWELKREIVQAKRLTSANDFDLVVINAQNNEGLTI
jgi:protein MPE1